MVEFMGSGYTGISFVGLLAECDEHVALDIDARRVNVIKLKDAQKRASGIFFLENWSLVLVGTLGLVTRILWLLLLVKLMGPGRVNCAFMRS